MTSRRRRHHATPLPNTSPAFAWVPSFTEQSGASELAILAVVVGVLDVLHVALTVAHRQIFDDERPYWIPSAPGFDEAVVVLRRADQLRRAVCRYRAVITPQPPAPPAEDDDDRDLPF